MKKSSYFLFLASMYLALVPIALAGSPSSTNYTLQDYGFGAGGNTISSTNYSLLGTAGEIDNGGLSSTNYKTLAGLIYTMQANVPGKPTLSNPATNYDRLQFIIDPQNNPSDTTYAIAISTDGFASDTRYIKSDGTLSTTLASSDYKTYTAWGGASGSWVTGLAPHTNYSIKATAMQGSTTDSGFGPVSDTIQTSDPSLTFSINSNSVTFANLNAANSYTDSAQSSVLTTSTNAYNGYTIYGSETSPLTFSTYTINNYAGTNSTPTAWSGTGFGYTTSDTNLANGTANRFNNATYYAGLPTAGPDDPVADHTAVVQNASIVNEQFTISYRVTASSTLPAGTYKNTIRYTIVPVY